MAFSFLCFVFCGFIVHSLWLYCSCMFRYWSFRNVKTLLLFIQILFRIWMWKQFQEQGGRLLGQPRCAEHSTPSLSHQSHVCGLCSVFAPFCYPSLFLRFVLFFILFFYRKQNLSPYKKPKIEIMYNVTMETSSTSLVSSFWKFFLVYLSFRIGNAVNYFPDVFESYNSADPILDYGHVSNPTPITTR